MLPLLHNVLEAVKQHAEDTVPFECCGLIDEEGAVLRCENNSHDRTTQFLIAPHEFRRVSRGRRIAGVYHSHVEQAAYISQRDRDGMTFDGLYVVASVMNGIAKDVKVFLFKDSKFTPVTIPEKADSQ